ncbi:hypothetical protein CB0940_07891 [Cercospora beticola]|uniref:Uncharacterized protein n=1 Tax=Cercospora beticola TaxID=122368 RepID=A0A2G5HAJ9_CERBT|nr:hypothetical protein CB0940_07891 [Cercospora beticola]PIA89570.1 hypothetical protein CB0940_07891 [Cercospora beticola]WPB03859.1 hypothetical protein RHO25_008503 [Cercospora beticola]CAK1357364.1 unnamed protein product [Cercospora beticola]
MRRTQQNGGRKARPGPASSRNPGKPGVSFSNEPLLRTGSNRLSPHKTQSPGKSSFRSRQERYKPRPQDDDEAMDIDISELGSTDSVSSASSEAPPDIDEQFGNSGPSDRGNPPTLTTRFDEDVGRALFRARLEQSSDAGSDNNGKDEMLVLGIEELKGKLVDFASRVPLVSKTETGYTDKLLKSSKEQLVRYIGSIAMGGRKGEEGWKELLTDAEARKAIVMGVVARALKEHVFGDYLFGADDELREKLESIDTSGTTHDGFVRTQERATLVNQNRIDAHLLAQDVFRVRHQLAKMLKPFWAGKNASDRSVRGMGEEDLKALDEIIKHAASISHLIRRAPDVVYYWSPAFKDEEFEPASMEALNLATMIRTSPYDKVTDDRGFERAVLRKQEENSEAIVRIVVFPAVVAYRQYGGSLAAAEIKVEKEGSRRLPPDVRDRHNQPITVQQGFRSKLISKSVVHLSWGKQMLLTKEAGTAAHLDAVRDGHMGKYSRDSANHVELHKLYEAVHDGARVR